jgi:hypothetical protein
MFIDPQIGSDHQNFMMLYVCSWMFLQSVHMLLTTTRTAYLKVLDETEC